MRSPTLSTASILALLNLFLPAIHAFHIRNLDLLAQLGLNPADIPINSISSTSSLLSQLPGPPPPDLIDAEYVELPIDHFSPNDSYSSPGTFHNRFWVQDDTYLPGGPVFLFDIGEADAGPYANGYLTNKYSYLRQLMEEFSGVGIVWEHRYYGNSTPGGFVDINTPAENFRWLTTQQSLADIVAFAKIFKRINVTEALTPDQTPWIFIGGSYPGMRAAFMRAMYPETIYASFASSAPVQAVVDMSVYFEPVVRGMRKYGYGNCVEDIHADILHIDRLLEDPKTTAAVKIQFLGPGAENNTNGAFAEALTAIFYDWQGAGMESSLKSVCEHISTDPETGKRAPEGGWAGSKGVEWTVERFASWSGWVAVVKGVMNGATCKGRGNGTDTGNEGKGVNCDLGFFQSTNLGPNQIVSKFNSLKHQQHICHRQFPDASRDLLPAWPRVDRTNQVFGGWDIRPSNTYWSGGEFDPWRTLSPLTAEPGVPRPRPFTQAPKCGVDQDKGDVFGYVLSDAQHAYDFRLNEVGEGEKSRQFFRTALGKWLECFRAGGGMRGRGTVFELT
ncbi:peptidase S28 [Byssothecium circinans]|uniref:Peptidase S28 n=1 Tax=Byssothecium circinans TaxID=147558 RepID=A0A6A5TWQ5_9PLEO|nr:peptidase S28 [Byssothecium circinans]